MLAELISNGPRELIALSTEAELSELLAHYSGEEVNGKRQIGRNGYLPTAKFKQVSLRRRKER